MSRNPNQLSTSIWQSFFCSLLFTILFPLFPLWIELTSVNSNLNSTLVISGVMLVIGIGVSSETFLQFVLSLIIGVCNSLIYGFSDPQKNNLMILLISCGTMIAWHIIERFIRHVIKKQPFFDFGKINI
jgi:hypothetical protein